MITIILSILGIIFLIWITIVFFLNIVLNIVYKITDDCKYTYLKRSSVIYDNEYDEWYLIPSFCFHIDSITKYPTMRLLWLKWQFVIMYHFQTEDEEMIEVKTRRQYLTEKDKI